MSFKFILFLVLITYSFPLQGSVNYTRFNKIKNNNEVYGPQKLHYKTDTYSQDNWIKKNALVNDFIDYSPPAEKRKIKKKFRKKRYKKTKRKEESSFWSALWTYVVLPILGFILVPLVIGVVFSPLVLLILGVVLGLSNLLILAIIMLGALLITSTLFHLIGRGYTLYVSLIANVYLLILSLIFLIWGATLAFPMLWIAGLILLLAILVLSLLIYLVEMYL